jgi:hypothetical protein
MSYSFGLAIIVLVQNKMDSAKVLVHGWNLVLAATMRFHPTFMLQSGRRPQHHIRSLTNVSRTTALPLASGRSLLKHLTGYELHLRWYFQPQRVSCFYIEL